MPILRLPGPPALSAFRHTKLLEQLAQAVPGVEDVSAHYEHLVDLEKELTKDERRLLDELLLYGPAYSDYEVSGHTLLVVPRLGTISPWSSKATDIARNCNLGAVRRIERGISYSLKVSEEFKPELQAVLASCIHDRMTETVCPVIATAAGFLSATMQHRSRMCRLRAGVAARLRLPIPGLGWRCQKTR